MSFEAIRPFLSGLAGALLVPLIMTLWGRLSPPAKQSEFDSISEEALKARNNWIDRVACVLSVAGVCSAVVMYKAGAVSDRNPWPLGLGFGLMVILPVAFISFITLPRGLRRYQEFWRFYELKYGIGVRSLTVVYSLIGGLGIVSAYKLVF